MKGCARIFVHNPTNLNIHAVTEVIITPVQPSHMAVRKITHKM